MTRKTELESALYWYNEEKRWVEDHGSTLAAYVQRYGSALDADHLGDGGEAIYAADMAALNRAEQRAFKALERSTRPRSRS